MSSPEVILHPGTSLQGRVVYARGCDVPVHAYVGVPYAQPPVGPLRFRPPQQVQLWQGCKQATEFGPIAPQDKEVAKVIYFPHQVPVKMEEDCLYLNVWTPASPSRAADKRLPVIVWIHGGAFISGFSDMYDGTAVAAMQDVIYISINYRLGIFGFLCTGDGYIPGNMGLLDQLEALQWVQRYIHHFGGDANNVTLCGESAGAISINMHMVSPLAKGLFHKAISESGSCAYPFSAWPQANAKKFLHGRLNNLGYPTTSGADIVNFLNTKSTADILKDFLIYEFPKVIDGHYLPDSPTSLYEAGQFHQIPFLTGFNSHEGTTMMQLANQATEVNSKEQALKFTKFVIVKQFYRGQPNSARVVQGVYDTYFGDCAEDSVSLTKAAADLFAHVLFVAPTIMIARLHAAKAETYVYMLNHRPFFSVKPSWAVADHGDEIPYVGGEPFLSRFPDMWPDEDKTLCKHFMDYWCNFARTGDPNISPSQGSKVKQWPKFRASDQRYMLLQPELDTAKDYQPDRMDFWLQEVPSMQASPPQARY